MLAVDHTFFVLPSGISQERGQSLERQLLRAPGVDEVGPYVVRREEIQTPGHGDRPKPGGSRVVPGCEVGVRRHLDVPAQEYESVALLLLSDQPELTALDQDANGLVSSVLCLLPGRQLVLVECCPDRSTKEVELLHQHPGIVEHSRREFLRLNRCAPLANMEVPIVLMHSIISTPTIHPRRWQPR